MLQVAAAGFENKTTKVEVKTHRNTDATVMLDAMGGQPITYHSFYQTEDLINQLAVNYTRISRILRLGESLSHNVVLKHLTL